MYPHPPQQQKNKKLSSKLNPLRVSKKLNLRRCKLKEEESLLPFPA
jgi:hypothetical protein